MPIERLPLRDRASSSTSSSNGENAARIVRFERCPETYDAVCSTRDTPLDSRKLPPASFLDALGVSPDGLAWCSQVHGSRILALTEPGAQGEADGLITNRPGLALAVRTADCAPLFFVDPEHGAIGVAHAGWRGAAAGIAGDTVTALRRVYGSRPEALWVGIGPAIGPDAYQVGEEVYRAFDRRHFTADGDRWRFDLPGAIAADLHSAGVPPANIERSNACTASDVTTYHSYRVEQTSARLLSLVFSRSARSRS